MKVYYADIMPPVPGFGAELFGGLALSLSVVIYLRLVWHKHTDASTAADDQLGVKTFCATLAIMGVLMAGGGLIRLLSAIVTWGEIKVAFQTALPQVLVGAAVLGFVTQVYLPRTNHEQFPKAMRLTAGAIATIAGVFAVASLANVLTGLFTASWKPMLSAFTTAAVAGGAAAGSLVVLSKLSGINIEADDLAQGVAQMAQNAAHNAAQNIQQAVGEPQPVHTPQAQPAAAPQPQAYQQPAPAPAAAPQPQAYQQPAAPAPGGFQPAPAQAPAPGGFQPAPAAQRPPGPPGPPPPGGYKR